MRPRRYALVAGGGTGGHLVPALALAHALSKGMPPQSVELVGTRRGLDAQMLEGSGLPVTLLPGRGLSRRPTVQGVLRNMAAISALALAVLRSVAIVGSRRPAVVVAMGGYASVPVALAAWMWRVPVVLVNVDAVPGAANRLVGRFAAAAAVAFAGTPLARSVVTGAPVRPDIVSAAGATPQRRAEARRTLGIPSGRVVVACMGGSLGAKRINEATLALAVQWAARQDVAIYHVVGRRDFAWVQADRPSPGGLWYEAVEFQQDMASFYLAADIVVCRAGANTVAELAVVGVASLLVPLPNAPGDHQSANARALESVGASIVIPDESCSASRLAGLLEPLVAEKPRLVAMSRAARSLGRPDALEAVAEVVRDHASVRRAS